MLTRVSSPVPEAPSPAGRPPEARPRNRTTGEVRLSRNGKVAVLTIDNPPANCITIAMFERLGEHVREIDADRSIRAAVIHGAGHMLYTAGADIEEMDDHAQRADRETITRTWLNRIHPVVDLIDRSKTPFICAMKGISMGAGLEIAAACDIRVAAESARFAMPEVKLGIMPGYGGTQRLTRLMGVGHALALIVGAQEIPIETAQRWGLVDVTTPRGQAEATALSLAEKMAGYGPVALMNAKRAIRRAAVGELDAGLAYEQELFIECAKSPEFDEGRRAFLEKRAPVFADE
jgi:enoyl-CoA hydratase